MPSRLAVMAIRGSGEQRGHEAFYPGNENPQTRDMNGALNVGRWTDQLDVAVLRKLRGHAQISDRNALTRKMANLINGNLAVDKLWGRCRHGLPERKQLRGRVRRRRALHWKSLQRDRALGDNAALLSPATSRVQRDHVTPLRVPAAPKVERLHSC